MEKIFNNKQQIIIFFALGVIMIVLLGFLVLTIKGLSEQPIILSGLPSLRPQRPQPSLIAEFKKIQKFSSEDDFKKYLKENENQGYNLATWAAEDVLSTVRPTAPMAKELLDAGVGGGEPERFSETNVQVAGIDEPDIVKTDGLEIYFSPENIYRYRPLMEGKTISRREETNGTKFIKAFPPADLAKESEIDATGNLLLSDKTLIVLSQDNKVAGFDVSDPKSPVKRWTVKLEDNNYIVTARLYKQVLYLIARTNIQINHPCPIKPASLDDSPIEIKCADIYHPTINVPVDSTFTVLALNPSSGRVENKISFVGSADSSVVYMSENALYVTYSYDGDFAKFFSNFLTEKGKDIVPDWVDEKIQKLTEYDLSKMAKLTELQFILETYYNSLSNDERLKMENEIANRMQDFQKAHQRDLEKTGIVKIALAKLEVAAVGDAPGRPLNQFSLDEYQNHLRIATTIGQSGFGMFWSAGESANDVYILDKDLKISGSVKDLGLGERIYSARFVGDKGYVVTFKQTDPFFVLDLSVPAAPSLKGELKIPGYSSYLHSITKDLILGIGKEGSRVKMSLFDVKDAGKPTELAKYALDEYWSDILNTHHAFLLDEKHQIFFLPGSKGGYVFSYKDNGLVLQKAISNIIAKRAIYISNYLYIIGEDQIIVFNEIDWEKVNSLDLNK